METQLKLNSFVFCLLFQIFGFEGFIKTLMPNKITTLPFVKHLSSVLLQISQITSIKLDVQTKKLDTILVGMLRMLPMITGENYSVGIIIIIYVLLIFI